MSQVHAIVWLDHHEAKVVSYSLDSSNFVEVHSEREDRRIHRRSGTIDSGKSSDDHRFFDEIAHELAGMRGILVLGPGNAKTAFATYLGKKHAAIAKHVVGVETADHPTDKELLRRARIFFRAADQLGVE
jgi:stalled ribosome rescue protein Dom34